MYNPSTRALELMEKTRAIAQVKGLNFAPPQPTPNPIAATFSSGGTVIDTSSTAPMLASGVPASQSSVVKPKVAKGSYANVILIVVIVVGLGAAGAYYLEWREQKREEQRIEGQ